MALSHGITPTPTSWRAPSRACARIMRILHERALAGTACALLNEFVDYASR
jgi:hypothetical protein